MLLPIDSYLGMEQKPARKVHYHFISFSVSVLILISSEKTEKKTCVSVLNWYHRAIFRHLNFKKWSECKVVYCTFLLSSKKKHVSTCFNFLTNAIPGPSPRRVQVRIGSSPVGTAASFKAKIGTVDLMNFYVFLRLKKEIYLLVIRSICTYIYIYIYTCIYNHIHI